MTTNRGLPSWGELFGDDVVAAAVLDRLLHRAVVFNIRGLTRRVREHGPLAEAVLTVDKPQDQTGKGGGR